MAGAARGSVRAFGRREHAGGFTRRRGAFFIGFLGAGGRFLQADRQEGSIPKSIGWDASVSTIWRPKMTQNIVVRVSGAVLDPGKGFEDLFTNAQRNKRYYSVLANIIFTY